MKKTIRKVFLVWNYDKEEQWLNEMSSKGLQLCDVGFCKYVFEEGTPGEYVYRLEFLEKRLNHAKSKEYIQFVKDTGAEQVGSLFSWVYFRKKSNGSSFDLFSDIGSRIKHLNRILLLLAILSGINLLNGTNQLFVWSHQESTVHLAAGILCLSVGLWIGYGFLRVLQKKRKLMKERMLHE